MSGTGGLLVIYSDELENNGYITANGNGSTSGTGGGAGGGSINIFYNTIIARNIEQAIGGPSGRGSGRGGNGTVTIGNITTSSFADYQVGDEQTSGGNATPTPEIVGLIPPMTSNTTTSSTTIQAGVASGNDEESGHPSYYAFDGNNSTHTRSGIRANAGDYVQYMFSSDVILTRVYTLGFRVWANEGAMVDDALRPSVAFKRAIYIKNGEGDWERIYVDSELATQEASSILDYTLTTPREITGIRFQIEEANSNAYDLNIAIAQCYGYEVVHDIANGTALFNEGTINTGFVGEFVVQPSTTRGKSGVAPTLTLEDNYMSLQLSGGNQAAGDLTTSNNIDFSQYHYLFISYVGSLSRYSDASEVIVANINGNSCSTIKKLVYTNAINEVKTIKVDLTKVQNLNNVIIGLQAHNATARIYIYKMWLE